MESAAKRNLFLPGLWALLAGIFAACPSADQDRTGTQRTAPTATQPPTRRVILHNPTGASLYLLTARRDAWQEPARPLGAGKQLCLALPPGRYAVQVGPGGRRLPLPLPPAELGYQPLVAQQLRIWPWPADLPGYAWIPAGPALRGDALGVGQEDERPLATPQVRGFWLAREECDNAAYVAFLNDLPPARVDPTWLDLDGAKCRIHWDAATGRYATDAPDLPVVTVSHPGATAYCRWLSSKTGVPHRLPTETEWEKAARGPGSRVYAYGDTCRAAAANQESGRLRAGGCYAANGFGLFDMTANAFEWCADIYHKPEAPAAGAELRVLRGGSFVLDGIFVRNAMRMHLRASVRADDVGFRVLRENLDPEFGHVADAPKD